MSSSNIANILSRRCERKLAKGVKYLRFEFEDFTECNEEHVRNEAVRLTEAYPDHRVSIESSLRSTGTWTITIIMIENSTNRIRHWLH